jgi:hypothetical protein
VDAPSCLRGSKARSNRSAPVMGRLCPSAPGTRACGFSSRSGSRLACFMAQWCPAGLTPGTQGLDFCRVSLSKLPRRIFYQRVVSGYQRWLVAAYSYAHEVTMGNTCLQN